MSSSVPKSDASSMSCQVSNIPPVQTWGCGVTHCTLYNIGETVSELNNDDVGVSEGSEVHQDEE